MFQPEGMREEVPFLILNNVAQAIKQVALDAIGVQPEKLLARHRVSALKSATEGAFHAQKYIVAKPFLLRQFSNSGNEIANKYLETAKITLTFLVVMTV